MSLDYTQFREAGSAAVLERQSTYWWKADESEVHQAVTSAAKLLRTQQKYRTQENLRHARLYGNFDVVGFGARDYTRSTSGPSWSANKISLNLVAACIDTLVAKIAKNRPRPTFQTFGGDWKLQQKAKALDKFCQGQFYETKIYRQGRRVATDAATFGTGCLKVVEINGRIRVERTLPEELLVDDADGIHGEPRQLFQTKAYSREVLLENYGDTAEKRDAILRANRIDPARGALQAFGDLVEVYEAWHLPSNPDASEKQTDGKHVLALETVTLVDEPWTKSYFPFAFMRFVERLAGFYGQGIAERLIGKQLEINRLLSSVSEQLRRKGKGRIFLEMGSKVVPAHLTNNIGDIVWFNGAPPVIDNGNAVAPEEFEQIERLWKKGFEEIGISLLSATMQKPSGLDSKVALREYNDIESERFVLFGQAYEELFLDTARIMIDMTRDAAKKGEKYEVRVPNKKVVERIDWSEVDLDEDAYLMQCFPVSSLPTTPVGRRQEIQEYINMGWIDPVEGRRLMDVPDLEASSNLAAAAIDDVDATIEAALETAKYQPIDEFQNIDLLISRATAAYLRARRQGANDKSLQTLRLVISDAAGIKAAATKPPPPDPSMMAGPAAAAGPSDMQPPQQPAPTIQ